MAELGALDRLRALRNGEHVQSTSSGGVLDRLREQAAGSSSSAANSGQNGSGVLERLREQAAANTKITTPDRSGTVGVLDRLRKEYGSTYRSAASYSARQAVEEYNKLYSDYRNFTESAQKALEGAGYTSAAPDQSSFGESAKQLREKSEALRATLRLGRSAMGEEGYQSMLSNLDEIGSSVDTTMGAFNNNLRYASRFNSEEAYNTAIDEQKTYQEKVSFDQEAGAREIRQMERELQDFTALTRAEGDAEGRQRAESYRQKYGSPQELEKLISRKKAFAKDAARIQNGIALAGVADSTSQHYDPEFERYAQDGARTIRGLMRDFVDFRALTRAESDEEGRQRAEAYRQKYGSPQALEELLGKDMVELYDQMTEEELATYGYHYSKNGKQAAQDYLDSIKEELNKREAEKEHAANYKDDTLAQMAFGVAAGLDQFGSNVKNLFNGDDYIPTSKNQYLSGMVWEDLEDVGPKLPEQLGGASLGQVAYDAINTTANMAPSILASMAVGAVSKTAGSAVGLGLMGASAAGGAYQEKLNQGYTKAEAGTYAAMVGASEVVLEKVLGGITQVGGKALGKTVLKGLSQVDNVLGRVAKKVGSSTVGKIVGSGLSEAVEEGLQTILEPVFWNVVSGEEIDVEKEEVLYSALLGAVTGVAFEGADAIPDAVRNAKANRSYGKAVTAVPGAVEALKQTSGVVGQEIGGNAQRGLEKLSEKVGDQQAGGATARIRNMVNTQRAGKLYRKTADAVSELNARDIASALHARGWDWDKATAVGKAMAESQVFGQSREQSGVLEQVKQDPVYREVLAEVENGQSAVAQRLGRLKAVEEGRITLEEVTSSEDLTANTTGSAAANENTAPEGGVQYSLRKFVDGKRFVDVQADQHLFDGLSDSEMNSRAKQTIKEKFVGKVIGIDNQAFVNGASAHEYVFPSKKIAPDIREAKLRASTELDNLLDAGTNFRNVADGADGHVHENVTGGFDYYDTIFKVGQEYYSGRVNVMNVERGKLLKDVTQIRNITKDIISSYGQNPKSDFLRDASMNSIPNKSENVNTGEGEALLKSTGEAVGIMGVSSVKNGTVRLKLEDGRIVDAVDVEHSSAEETLVYETAIRLSDNALTANMLIENYNGETSALEYTKGIEEAWLAGKANAPRNQVQALPFASRLAENQRWTAYKLGQISAGKNAGAAVAANPPQTARKRGYVRTEGMTKEDVRNTFNMAQKESYGVLNTIAKVTGIDMVLYRSTSDNKGNLRSGTVDGVDVGTSQGMFSWKNDKIYIDVNAGVLNAAELGDLARYAMLRTFDHEFTHFMEKYNPEEWAILKDAVFSTMRRNGADPEVLVRQYMDEHKGADRDTAEREVVAEAMVDILPESRFVEELAQKHRSIFEKLLEKLKEFVQKIRNHFAAMGASRSAEPAAVKETVDGVVKYAEGLVELFDRVAVGAVENYQAQQAQKNAADGDRVQMQARRNGSMDDAEIQAAQSIGRKSVNAFTSADMQKTEGLARRYWAEMREKSPFFRAWFGDWRVNDQTPVQIANKAGDTRGIQKNEDTGWSIQVSGMVFNETNRHTDSYNVAAQPYLGHINDIVKKAVLLDTYGVDQNKLKSPNSLLMHSLYAVADIGNGPEIIKLYVEEMNNPNSAQTGKRAYQLQNVEKYQPQNGSSQNTASSISSATGTIRTVADLFAAVKRKDSSFIPKPASKIANEDGTPKVMYHGSPAQFTIFDKKKAKSSGLYGKGFYFTDSISHAGTYGQRYDVYLNIRNPLEHGRSTVSRAQVRKFLEAVEENEDYSIENYGTYNVDAILKNILGGKTRIDAFQVLQDINATAIGDLVEAVELFNKVNGTKFDGIVAPTETVAFYPEQIKSATDNIGTFDGSNPDIRYQDRVGTLTNWDILEQAADIVGEQKLTADQREAITTFNRHLEAVKHLSTQREDLYAAIRNANDSEKNSARNRIAKLSKQINAETKAMFELENTAVLKRVLTKARAVIEEDQAAKRREAMTAYRKKSAEGRQKTEMRHKIQKVVKKLNDLLIHESKDRHVPESMKKAVAAALDAVNMDTVGAEERIAKYDDLIAKATDPDVIASLTETRDRIAKAGDRLADRIGKLKAAYDSIKNGAESSSISIYDEVIANKIQEVLEEVGDTSLRDMSLSQLEAVYEMYTMVAKSVSNANRSFKEARGETIEKMGADAIREVGSAGKERQYSPAALEAVKKFGWDNLKPYYAFSLIGSDTLSRLYDNVRKGEDTWAVDVEEAKGFFRKQSQKYGYDSWDQKKSYHFSDVAGRSFELTLPQIMSLYAYSKRAQADKHLAKGGFVFDSAVEVVKKKRGIPVKYKVNTADAYNLSKEEIYAIVSTLTKEQAAFVDAMQEYLSSVMGEKGNEVSLALYDVRLFKEKNYFPLKSASQYTFQQTENTGEVKLKNSGFSKKTVANASNPIILSDFMSVWGSHVNDMSMYHAFVLPLEDFNRVYNYKTLTSEKTTTRSVKAALQNVYGDASTRYIKQMLEDINGGARADDRSAILSRWMGKFKKGSVFANASVVIQQPSAIARAGALVDLKHFFVGKLNKQKHKQLWEEVKRYAPVAIIKEMGYFDTNMGLSTVEYLTAKDYDGITEKTKAIFNDNDYRDKLLSRPAALADEISWCYIWQAVKRETKEKHPAMDIRSEAFLKKAGERFTEVVTRTQVYDSVLSRSGLMRSKDTGVKMMTAFMAEPTTSMNMVVDALIQGKRGERMYARNAVASVLAAQLLNSVLVSFVYAARDDDEDESYWEKYLAAFSGKMLDSINPLTYLPFVKDIVSIARGYSVERSDMAVISDIYAAWNNLSNENISPWRKVEDFAGSVAQVFGIPAKNIMRDLRAIYQVADSAVNGPGTTAMGIWTAIREEVSGKDIPRHRQLYEAMTGTDTAWRQRIEAAYADEASLETAVKKGLREFDPRICEAAQARIDGDFDEYERIFDEIEDEGNFTHSQISGAIQAEINDRDEEEKADSSVKQYGMYTIDDFVKAVQSDDHTFVEKAAAEIQNTAKANGKSAEQAEDSFVSAAKKACKEQYLTGGFSREQAVAVLTEWCSRSKGEAQADISSWQYAAGHGDADVSSQWFETYYEKIEGSGIDIDTYVEYRTEKSGYTKRADILGIIDGMDLTDKQKDALYFAEGLAESTLHEAPWH